MTTLTIPITLLDGDGFEWDIGTRGQIGDGTSDAFDTGMALRNPATSSFSTGQGEDGDREIVIGSFIQGDIQVTRKIFVSPTDGFIRYLEVVTNTGAAAQNFSLEIGSGLGSDGSTVATTSSGDAVLNTSDRWIVTDDDGGSDPFVAHVFTGPGGQAPASATQVGDDVSFVYDLQLGAGQTQIVMHFGVQANSLADAQATAQSLTALPAAALSGISALELSQIVNFESGPAATPLNLVGSASANVLYGGVLNDRIDGADGDDVLFGNEGDDRLLGGEGRDVVFGEGGDDIVNSGTGDDVVYGGEGDDTISGSTGADSLFGEDGSDSLSGSDGNDMLLGGAGVDSAVGGAGDDVIDGGSENDVLYGDASNALVTTFAQTTIPATGQGLAVSMTIPDTASGTTLDVSGFVSRTPVTSNVLNVAFVIDVSGSMADPFSTTNPVGDINKDGQANTLLDATILAYENLLKNIVDQTEISATTIGVIPFETNATTDFVGLASSDGDQNGVADVIDALRSLDLAGNTNFEAGLQQAVSFFGARPEGQNLVFFLSDGENNTGGSFADEVSKLIDPAGINATIHSFGVGAGASPPQLDLVDDGISNNSATIILDPLELSDILVDPGISQAEIDRVELLVNGVVSQTIDGSALIATPLGLRFDFSGTLSNLNPSANDTIVARVIANDSKATKVQTSQVVEQLATAFGNDRLFGGAGDDIVNAGGGDDVASGGIGGDIVRGEDGNDRLFGDAGNDRVEGGAGSDYLDGGIGIDDMVGGLGNDVYRVDNAGDATIEGKGQGTADKVIVVASYALKAGVEIEVMTTNSSTAAVDINLTGNLLSQEIFGNAGVNKISSGGLGGAADILRGYAGNDQYFVYNAKDVVLESVTQGTLDRVSAGVSYVLGAGVYVEQLTTTSSSSTAAINLTGNALAQEITGNAGDNVISDGGIGAADILRGMGGNDTYRIYNSGDTIIETASQGTADRVLASVDYTLGKDVRVELMTTSSSSGTSAINLTGNVFAQEIVGNAGNNILNDGGAGAADTMRGLGGNDIYRVFNTGDTIVESASQGTADRVMTTVNYTLGTGVHIELLTTNSSAGTAAINLTGNEIAQEIIGNAGNNRLEGRGGADTLRGLGGDDTFVFATKLGGGNVDTILDFNVADDRFLLSDSIFTALATGTLAAAAFRANTTGLAGDSSDRIIYETDTGELYYDRDGTGAAAAVEFATITKGLALTNADFVIA
jgi:Ca2+-binding RTX toxin-like protein